MMLSKTDLINGLSNRWWRLNHLYWIQDAETGREIPFRANAAQLYLYRSLHYRNVILKARQLGFSTFIMLLILDSMLFQRGQSCGVIAHKRPAAQDLMRNKIKFGLKRIPPALSPGVDLDNETALHLANDSGVVVDTSLRSGTYQILHISEYGDISLRRPDQAKEIKSGALNTVAPSCFVFIESTAKGIGGEFYDICQTSRKLAESGQKLTPLDYKFHFFAWFKELRYNINPENVIIPIETREYFDELKAKHGIELTDGQKAWYHIKSQEQGEEMKREYPSTPDEAFEQAVEGQYFARQMRQLRQSKRITAVPHDPNLLVHTAWDLGIDDAMAIWFFQLYGQEIRMIRYLEGNDEGLAYYVRHIRDEGDKHGYAYGSHLGPHDIDIRDLSTGKTRHELAESLGLRFTVVPRVAEKSIAIEQARQLLPRCVIDQEHCARGIECLDHYRKKWNDAMGVFSSGPMHDEYSHGADAFQTLARGLELVDDRYAAKQSDPYAPPPKRRGGMIRGRQASTVRF